MKKTAKKNTLSKKCKKCKGSGEYKLTHLAAYGYIVVECGDCKGKGFSRGRVGARVSHKHSTVGATPTPATSLEG